MTENGACFSDLLAADGTEVVDIRLFARSSCCRARCLYGGVKLRGYFVWSLLDNFEWQEGYSRRFGVIYVDFKTLKRTPKASYQWLEKLIKANSHELQR